MQQQNYKISLIGEGGSGKTTFVKRLLGEDFEKKYVATLGVEVHPFRPQDKPQVCFNLWDTAGQEKFGGLRGGYFVESDACLVFVDLANPYTLYMAGKWIMRFREVCPEVPIIYVANKSDQAIYEFPNLESSVTISCKEDQNLDKVVHKLYKVLDIAPSSKF